MKKFSGFTVGVVAALLLLWTPIKAQVVNGVTTIVSIATDVSGLGSGVATALGLAVSGSGGIALVTNPALISPALGTPTAINLTNGTALPVATGISGLGTGVATGLGNAVTGSGAPVLATSPTLVTPSIGVAGASSVAVSGASQPANGIYLPGAGTVGVVGASKLEFFAGATNELDFAVTTAGLWTSTPPWTFTNAAIKMTALGTGTNADDVCWNSNGTLQIQASTCTISSLRFKNVIGDYQKDAAGAVTKLEPIIFTMKPGEAPNPDINYDKPQLGLSAENVAAIEPLCTLYDPDGVTPKSYRPTCLIAVLVAGMKEQQRQIEKLQAQVVK